jgi:hypothetical protein
LIYYPQSPLENSALAEWCADRIPHVRGGTFGACQSMAVMNGEDVRAVVVFHDWQPRFLTMQCSMAANTPKWATRDVLRGLMFYVFRTAGANKLWTAIPHDAERVLKFNRGIGLKPEGTLRSHFGHKRHAIICSMLRAEWERSRWCMESVNDGQERSFATAGT